MGVGRYYPCSVTLAGICYPSGEYVLPHPFTRHIASGAVSTEYLTGIIPALVWRETDQQGNEIFRIHRARSTATANGRGNDDSSFRNFSKSPPLSIVSTSVIKSGRRLAAASSLIVLVGIVSVLLPRATFIGGSSLHQ